MIDIVEKKVPHSFRNKYLRNSGSVSLSTTTPMPSNVGGAGVDVLKVDDGRLSSDDNVFSSLRALLEIKSRIIAISDSDTELSDDNTFSSLRALKETQDIVDREILKALERAEALFLSKTKDDTTAGHLTIEGGTTTDLLQSSQFTPGTLGAGYLIEYDPITGKSYIEVDEMYVRLKAVFDSLVIKESQHVGGQQIYSCASIECTKVEHVYREALFDSDHKRLRDSEGKYLFALLSEPVYRCYFTSTDGSKTILNQFAPGDLAQCRQFDIKDGTTGHAKNRYYWRYVVAIGGNYIDLSVTDCEEGSDVPEAGDKIIQLGNRTDVSRQNAIIMSAYGDNAPSKQMLQGINSYSLVDRAVLEEGFDRVTNQAYTKTFGRNYVGAKDKSSYMEYTQEHGLELRGAIKGVSDDGGSVYELMPDGTSFFGVTDPVTKKKTGIIQGVDCMVAGEKRTGIFSVVDDDVVFELDPVNKNYSFCGKVETAVNGKRIVINPNDSSIRMYSSKGSEILTVKNVEYGNENTPFDFPSIKLMSSDDGLTFKSEITIDPVTGVKYSHYRIDNGSIVSSKNTNIDKNGISCSIDGRVLAIEYLNASGYEGYSIPVISYNIWPIKSDVPWGCIYKEDDGTLKVRQ